MSKQIWVYRLHDGLILRGGLDWSGELRAGEGRIERPANAPWPSRLRDRVDLVTATIRPAGREEVARYVDEMTQQEKADLDTKPMRALLQALSLRLGLPREQLAQEVRATYRTMS